MKKICGLAALLVLCSCSENLDTAKIQKPVKFTATIETESDTKTSLGEKTEGTYPVLWSKGDEISVLTAGDPITNDKLVLESGEGTECASFSGSSSSSSTSFYAIYPYNEKNTIGVISSTAPYIYWDGAEQTAVKDSYDPSKAVMVAYAEESEDGTVNFAFKNVLSYIKFTTNYKCKTVTFEAKGVGVNVACTSFRESGVDGKSVPVFYPAVDGGTNKITLSAADGGLIEAGTYYIMALPSVLTDGFKITFTSEVFTSTKEAKTYSKETSSSVSLSRSKILNLGTFDLASNLVEFEGYGNSGSPFLIEDFAQLQLLSKRANSGDETYVAAYYKQTADIDMTGVVLTPIGCPEHMFAGNYNGDGHKISNVTFGHFTGDEKEETGLFGDLYLGTVRNLTVENPSFSGSGDGNITIMGIICSHAYSDEDGNYKCRIENCHTLGTVTYEWNESRIGGVAYGGGIVGAANANIEIVKCINEADLDGIRSSYNDGVWGSSYLSLGGIIGYVGPVKTGPTGSCTANALVYIDRCRNEGDVSFNVGYYDYYPAVGGIIGRAEDDGSLYYQNVAVHIYNCVNAGEIGLYGTTLATASVGGIFGENNSDGYSTGSAADPELFNCLNNGPVYSEGFNTGSHTGGIVGWIYDSDTKVNLCVNLGDVSAKYTSGSVADIIGNGNGTVVDCFTEDDGKNASYLNWMLSGCYNGRDGATWVDVDTNGLDILTEE